MSKNQNAVVWPVTGMCSYKLKTRWKFTAKDMTTPRGESMTVPDDSYAIKDLIRKYAGHIDPSISKLSEYNGSEDKYGKGDIDFDDVDYNALKHADLVDQVDVGRAAAQRRHDLLKQMSDREAKAVEERIEKLAAEKLMQGDDEGEDEGRSPKNTPKSRNYSKPKSNESPED